MSQSAPHKAGFVNIIGNPNAGKSTLMNEMVGEKLSIITSKAQTTRHRIMGIVNGENFQIVYSDTPGALIPNYKLQERMMDVVNTALSDADVILLVIDITDKKPLEKSVIEKLKTIKTPVLLLINKIDLSDQPTLEKKAEECKKELPQAEIIPISATKKFNLVNVFDRIMALLPESPAYYDKEALTDRNQRFFVSEIIREKILLFYSQEIPYAVEVYVDSFKEKPDINHISATIYVERDSQKGILIGAKGSAMKRLGTEARKDIEEFTNKKAFLQLFVKVDPEWRNNENRLKKMGY